MSIYKKEFKEQGDMEAYVIGVFNTPNEAVKKIDVRSYQGGFKVIIKTVEKEK